ncbi:hypothetical protein [Nevskia sp.]|uniref:hypothetical protein n=1 Tax=Nevskia sp. TaxID=1929292 RepID=UPI0025F04FA0|nr:hypothetical protein [Nevskia sp.]
MTKYEAATNLATFLQDKTGSVCGSWKGKLNAAEQRNLIGRFIGKGMIYIDGANETIEHWVKTGFGLDADATFSKTWGAL